MGVAGLAQEGRPLQVTQVPRCCRCRWPPLGPPAPNLQQPTKRPNKQINKQTNKKTNKQTTKRQTYQINKQTNKHRNKQMNRRTNKHTNIQTYEHTNRETNKHKNKQKGQKRVKTHHFFCFFCLDKIFKDLTSKIRDLRSNVGDLRSKERWNQVFVGQHIYDKDILQTKLDQIVFFGLEWCSEHFTPAYRGSPPPAVFHDKSKMTNMKNTAGKSVPKAGNTTKQLK